MKQETHTHTEYDAFDSLLRRVVSVPHSEIKRREEEYKAQRGKAKKKKRAKTSPAARASNDKD
jgi:hypothetical protein